MRLILSTKILLSSVFFFTAANSMLLFQRHITGSTPVLGKKAVLGLAKNPAVRIRTKHCLPISQENPIPIPRDSTHCGPDGNVQWYHLCNSAKSQRATSTDHHRTSATSCSHLEREMRRAAEISGELQTAAGSMLPYTARRTRAWERWPKDAISQKSARSRVNWGTSSYPSISGALLSLILPVSDFFCLECLPPLRYWMAAVLIYSSQCFSRQASPLHWVSNTLLIKGFVSFSLFLHLGIHKLCPPTHPLLIIHFNFLMPLSFILHQQIPCSLLLKDLLLPNTAAT